jgi:hypothetical protein
MQALAFKGDAASTIRDAGGRLALLELLALVTGVKTGSTGQFCESATAS